MADINLLIFALIKIKKMGSKKGLIGIAVGIIVIAAGIYFYKGGFSSLGIGTVPVNEGTSPASQVGTGGQEMGQTTGAQTGIGSIGKMTDDIYVEMIVQAAYQAQKNPATYVSNMESLYKKYGITTENVQAYGETLSNDPSRAQTVMQKYSQQLQQLMK